MALRAGYYGIKKKILEKVNALPGIKTIGTGLSLSSAGVLSATGSGGIDYSTTERKIGKWIDGSDLYQVSIAKTEPSSTTQSIDLSSYGIKELVYLYGVRYNEDIVDQHTWLIGKYWGDTLYETVQFVNNSLNFEKSIATAWQGTKLLVTIRYTKTS